MLLLPQILQRLNDEHSLLQVYFGKSAPFLRQAFWLDGQNGKKILATYDQRAEIEESHRQMKENQGLETLPSKKFVHVVFRIIMGVIGFNLMNLFLNSENCKTFEELSLKTLHQKRMEEENPKIIVYTAKTFAVLRFLEFLPLILQLESQVQKKLSRLFKNLDLSPAPS